MADAEKKDTFPSSVPTPELNQIDTAGQATDELVLSKDGLPLFPQPVVGDDLDPLNWSVAQKHSILAIVMAL